MTRMMFDKSLDKLDQDILVLAEKVEKILMDTVEGLEKGDAVKARAIMDGDTEINALQHDIEQSCLYLIARQQPIARDLRRITSALKMVTDFERIADQCSDIMELVARYNGDGHMLENLPSAKMKEMFHMAAAMYQKTVAAFREEDLALGERVCEADDIVDAYYSELVTEISDIMAEKKAVIHDAVNAIIIVKYIERIADHATNIAEWVIYRVNGKHADLNRHQFEAN